MDHRRSCQLNELSPRGAPLGGDADVVANGKSVGSIGKNEPVGELALFDDQSRSTTVTATEDLDVLIFLKANFVEVIRSSLALSLTLLKSAARRLRATNQLV